MSIQHLGNYTSIQTETGETGEIRESTKRKQGVYDRLRPATLALVLSLLAACSKAPEPVVSVVPPHPGIVELEQSDDMELSRLKSEYNGIIESIKAKYGIVVKIGEPSDNGFKGVHHTKKEGHSLFFIKKLDTGKMIELVQFIQKMQIELGKYTPDYLRQIDVISLVDKISSYQGENKPEKILGGFAGAHDITLGIKSGGKFSLDMAKSGLDHEIQHTVHISRSERWPFKEANDDTLDIMSEQQGYARGYGKESKYEDAATIAEEVMHFVRLQIPEYSIQPSEDTHAIQEEIGIKIGDGSKILMINQKGEVEP